MHKIFVVGFSRELDEMQLTEMFSYHGLVKTVTIIRDQQTGISKGYGFVDMLDQAGAERAINAIDGCVIENRTLSARYANRKPEQDNTQQNYQPARTPSSPENRKRTFTSASGRTQQRPRRPRK